MVQFVHILVKLTTEQKENIIHAYHNKQTIVLSLTSDSLYGNDVLFVPMNTVFKKYQKNQDENRGMNIKLSKTNIKKQVSIGPPISTLTYEF